MNVRTVAPLASPRREVGDPGLTPLKLKKQEELELVC